MRVVAVAILAGITAGGAEAGGLVPVGGLVTATVEAPGPAPLEVVRHELPQVGRDTAVQLGGTVVPTIEWRRRVEVRARTESGEPLTEIDRQYVRDLALVCRRGEVAGVEELLERNGTFVVEFDCAWLQGLEGRVSVQ
jgi:predicted sugar kinase